MTSSAPRVLPLWKVMPFFTRMVHSVALEFGTISSASCNRSWALLWKAMRELKSWGDRARSGGVTWARGSSVSVLAPPVRPTRRVPPLIGLLDEAGVVVVDEEELQAPRSPPAPSTAAPVPRAPRNSLRDRTPGAFPSSLSSIDVCLFC